MLRITHWFEFPEEDEEDTGGITGAGTSSEALRFVMFANICNFILKMKAQVIEHIWIKFVKLFKCTENVSDLSGVTHATKDRWLCSFIHLSAARGTFFFPTRRSPRE